VADCWSRLFQARVLDEIAGFKAEVQQHSRKSASQKINGAMDCEREQQGSTAERTHREKSLPYLRELGLGSCIACTE